MSGEHRQSKKTQLALALAQGRSITTWARANEVPRRTAYRWAGEPAVRSAVESYRRRVIDRVVGRLATRATWASDGIAKLAKSAKSESVRLSALRAILSDMMTISQFATLEETVAQVVEQLNDRAQTHYADRSS